MSEDTDNPEQLDEQSLAERARVIIPGGTSTGSKQLRALYGADIPGDAPSHYVAASGCEVTLAGGRTIIDCTMSLGAVAIDSALSFAITQSLRLVGSPSPSIKKTLMSVTRLSRKRAVPGTAG